MPEPVGRQLAQARQKRGLTLEEAAHETRMRPEKILALESDDYTCFPSNAYAKGFLKNYARYLGVDVADFVSTFDSTLPISIADYQYLNNAPEIPVSAEPVRRERRAPSILPLAIGAVLLVLALAGFWVYANAKRIFDEPSTRPTPSAQATPAPVPVLSAVPPELATPATLSLDAVPLPAAVPDPRPAAPGTSADHAILKGAVTSDPADHDVVTPVPVAEHVAAGAPPGAVNEILIASVKKTRVTVRRDDPKAPPIFDDFIYPGIQPLKLRGVRFFIESVDPAAVQITKNGLPIAFQAPGVAIQ